MTFFLVLIGLIAKRVKTTEENFLSKFGALFEEFNYSGLSSCYFYLIFTIRRYSIVAAILFFSSPLLKIVISFLFSLIVIFSQTCLYIFFVKPYKNKINQTYMILNEALTAAFYGYVGLQFLKIISYDKATQGMNSIKIIGVTLGVNAGFGLMSGLYYVYQFVKKYMKRKIVPLENNFTSQKVLKTDESSKFQNPLEKASEEKIFSF